MTIVLVMIVVISGLLTGCDEDIESMGPQFFAAGHSGNNYYFENSTDGWQNWPVYSAQSHYGVGTFSMGAFDRVVLVGEGGDGWIFDDIIGSVPSVYWEEKNLGTGNYEDAVFGNNVLVAVGENSETEQKGKIVRSTNLGNDWEEVHLESNTNTPFFDVIFADDRFIAVGKKVLYSDDEGATWTESGYSPPASFRAIAFDGDENLVAVGNTYTLVGRGDSVALAAYTSDCETWFTIEDPGTDKILNDVVYAPEPNRFIAAGCNGTILYSDDTGSTWTSVDVNTDSHLNSVAYGDGTLVAGGINSVPQGNIDTCYSTDHGATWKVLENQPGIIYDICWKP